MNPFTRFDSAADLDKNLRACGVQSVVSREIAREVWAAQVAAGTHPLASYDEAGFAKVIERIGGYTPDEARKASYTLAAYARSRAGGTTAASAAEKPVTLGLEALVQRTMAEKGLSLDAAYDFVGGRIAEAKRLAKAVAR